MVSQRGAFCFAFYLQVRHSDSNGSFCLVEPEGVSVTAEALSSLLRNEPWIKPLVLEPLKPLPSPGGQCGK